MDTSMHGVVGVGAVVVGAGLAVDVLAMQAVLVVASVVFEGCCNTVLLDGRSRSQSLVSCDLVPVMMILLVALLRVKDGHATSITQAADGQECMGVEIWEQMCQLCLSFW